MYLLHGTILKIAQPMMTGSRHYVLKTVLRQPSGYRSTSSNVNIAVIGSGKYYTEVLRASLNNILDFYI